MNYAFPALDTSTSGQVYDVPVPMSRYLEAAYDEGTHYTVLGALNRMDEMSFAQADDSPVIPAKQANEQWAVGNLKFDQPVRESVARLMNKRKREEMDREFFLTNGATKTRFVPGMAASMIASIMNPVDLGLMFVPFVGTEEAAAKATGVMGKMLARRLVTRETIQNMFPKAPFLTESVINGVAGQSLFEVPNLIAASQDKSNYGLGQAAFNIAAGGATAAALHGAIRAMGKLFNRLEAGTREAMTKQALNQFLRDEQIVVHDYVQLDEKALWEKIRFDEDAALSSAYDSIDMDLLAKVVREQYGEKVVSPAIKTSDGKIHEGPSHDYILANLAGDDKPKVDGFRTDNGRFISRDEAGQLVGLPDKGYNHLMFENDKLLSEQISTANPEQLGAAEFDRYNQLIEENPHLSKTDALKQIMAEREGRRNRFLMQQPEIQQKLEAMRQQSIRDFVEKERLKFEQEKQGKFNALKQQEIEKQIAAGKTLKPEDIQAAIPPEKFEDTGESELDADIAGLKKTLKLDEKTQEPKEEILQRMVRSVDKAIKSLDHDPTKLSLPLVDLMTLGLGRPVLKGLLLAVKEGLLLFQDLSKAIDHAMKWYVDQDKATPRYLKHGPGNNRNFFNDFSSGKIGALWATDLRTNIGDIQLGAHRLKVDSSAKIGKPADFMEVVNSLGGPDTLKLELTKFYEEQQAKGLYLNGGHTVNDLLYLPKVQDALRKKFDIIQLDEKLPEHVGKIDPNDEWDQRDPADVAKLDKEFTSHVVLNPKAVTPEGNPYYAYLDLLTPEQLDSRVKQLKKQLSENQNPIVEGQITRELQYIEKNKNMILASREDEKVRKHLEDVVKEEMDAESRKLTRSEEEAVWREAENYAKIRPEKEPIHPFDLGIPHASLESFFATDINYSLEDLSFKQLQDFVTGMNKALDKRGQPTMETLRTNKSGQDAVDQLATMVHDHLRSLHKRPEFQDTLRGDIPHFAGAKSKEEIMAKLIEKRKSEAAEWQTTFDETQPTEKRWLQRDVDQIWGDLQRIEQYNPKTQAIESAVDCILRKLA